MRRIAALLAKELADLRHNPGVFLPAILTGCRLGRLPVRHRDRRPVLHRRAAVGLERFRDRRGAVPHAAGHPRARSRRRDPGVDLPAVPRPAGRPDAGRRLDVGCGAQRHRREAGAHARAAAGDAADDLRAARREGARRAACRARADRVLVRRLSWRPSRSSPSRASGPACSPLRSLSLVFVLGPLAALLGAAAGGLRVVARQRRAQRAAVRRARIILPIAALLIAQFVGGIVLTARSSLAIAAALALGQRRPAADRHRRCSTASRS